MKCTHPAARLVGETCEGLGTVFVYWCPDCGALRRNMINWKCKDYGWTQPLQGFAEWVKEHGGEVET
jgi:hypothetical protein